MKKNLMAFVTFVTLLTKSDTVLLDDDVAEPPSAQHGPSVRLSDEGKRSGNTVNIESRRPRNSVWQQKTESQQKIYYTSSLEILRSFL